MRGKIVFAVIALACVAGAGLYLSPTALGKVQQLISGQQAASNGTDKTAKAPDNAKGGGGSTHSAS
ncbi:MAG: efflux RND transporter periplasmic adaptor subunit, partial [Mesorhizobium sp.]